MRNAKGKRPHIKTIADYLHYILVHATDTRHRVLLTDENKWLEEKMKEIAVLARRAKKLEERNSQKATA